ncbi:hypothetical protein D9M71_144530 [compost metagenome]
MIDAQSNRLVVATSLNDDPQSTTAQTNQGLARWMAEIQGLEYSEGAPASLPPGRRIYWVPSETVIGREQAKAMGIHGPLDLFGGYVEQAYQAGKAIAHPLIENPTLTPRGWSETFSTQVKSVVLDGESVFCRSDAWRCASSRLHRGQQRLKPATCRGGQGQHVVGDVDELSEALDSYGDDAYAEGLVIEDNLQDVQTLSVGQAMINGMLLSYHGVQHQDPNTRGNLVYGGSDLVVVRGDFDCLLALDLADEVRVAIHQAQLFDRSAHQLFPHFFASRRNYDIAQGKDINGLQCSGVLEQSWRIGGASSAELAALEAFVADPALPVVRASSIEIFQEQTLPANARVIYRGSDEHGDFLLKYAMVEPYD